MKSWKTSTTAIMALVTALSGAASQMLDGDPKTNPDWNILIPLIMSTLVGLFARDNDKSSEAVGAVINPPKT